MNKRIVIITQNPTLQFGFSKISNAIISRLLDKQLFLPGNIKIIDTLKSKMGENTFKNIDIVQAEQAVQYPTERIKHTITEFDPDIVLSFGDIWDNYGVGELIESKGFQWVYYIPVEYEHIQSVMKVDNKIISTSKLLDLVDFPIAYSRFGQTQLQNLLPERKISYIYHGYDPKEYYKLQTVVKKSIISSKIPDDAFIISTVGANGFRKGFDLIFMAFAKFIEKLPKEDKAKCYLYVHTNLTGTAGWNILELAKMEHLENNVILNKDVQNYAAFIPVDTMRNIYNVSDIYINLSRGEGFGIPVLEAAACGARIMCADYATPPEIISDLKVPLACKEIRCTVNGYSGIADINKASNLMRKVYMLRKQNPQKLQSIKMANASQAKKHTWDNILPAWEQLFTEGVIPAERKQKKLRMIKI